MTRFRERTSNRREKPSFSEITRSISAAVVAKTVAPNRVRLVQVRTERDPVHERTLRIASQLHRSIELFGQHALQSPDVRSKLAGLGLVLVEGPNDVIRLDTLGVPAVALCSNAITREQAAKAAQLARRSAGGIVTVFLDCDAEGEQRQQTVS